MSETAMKPKGRGANLSVRKFLNAIIRGATVADAAKAAGSKASSRHALHVVGARLLANPKCRQALNKVDGLLEQQFADFTRWGANVQAGLVKTTDQDRIALGVAAGRALGKYVTKVEVEHRRLEFRDFSRPRVIDAQLDPTPALPEPAPLPTQAFEVGAIEAAVAKPAPMPEEP